MTSRIIAASVKESSGITARRNEWVRIFMADGGAIGDDDVDFSVGKYNLNEGESGCFIAFEDSLWIFILLL